MGDQDEKKPVTSIDLNEVTPKASPESLQANGVEAGYTENTVPDVAHREGVGVSAPSSTVQPPTANTTPVTEKTVTPAVVNTDTNSQAATTNEPWWLSGEVEENGVKRFITLDEVLKQNPSLKSTLKGGDFLYNVLNYRQQHNLPALDSTAYKTMLGRHSLDKTVKQEKRERVRNFLADAIQPVTDVLKAAAAYGYGKAGRTFIPVDKAQGPTLGDKLREAEKIRAKQNWDEWADTFKMREKERIAAEIRAKEQQDRVAAHKAMGDIDVENYGRKKQIDQENLTPDQQISAEKLKAYNQAIEEGFSHEEALFLSGIMKRPTPKSSGSKSGGGKSSSSSTSNNNTTHYEIDGAIYTLGSIKAALEHAYTLEHQKEFDKDPIEANRKMALWMKGLTQAKKIEYLKKYKK